MTCTRLLQLTDYACVADDVYARVADDMYASVADHVLHVLCTADDGLCV